MSETRTSRPVPLLTLPSETSSVDQPGGSLLERLARALEQQGVSYCQWKGHWSTHRWSMGYGDVDLLVDRDAIPSFRLVLEQLGFKLVQPSAERQIPGTVSYFGHDPAVPRLLHLRVQYQLVLGNYWKPVYRIPIERPMLERSMAGQPFRLPSPSYRFLVFMLRMMLRQVGRPLLSTRAHWMRGIQIPLASLDASSDREELASILRHHLTSLDLPFFERCVRALQGESDLMERAVLPWQLHRRLRSNVRWPPVGAVIAGVAERILPAPVARIISSGSMRPSGGGVLVALIGADGAGMSTCARELTAWLEPGFPVMRVHLGNPRRSLLTALVEAALTIQRSLNGLLNRPSLPGAHLELLRHLCAARDRYRVYQRARRFAVAGGISLVEGYPVQQSRSLMGPRIPTLLRGSAGPLASRLREAEALYYRGILKPDVLCVLALDPELAVLRKPEQPAEDVRARARSILDTDWSSAGAHVVDAAQPHHQIVQRLKLMVWSML